MKNEGYFLEVDIQYPQKNIWTSSWLPIFTQQKKKFEKLVTNVHDKNEYFIHIRNLKQVLNHGLILKNVHRVIKFNQKDWLKSCIDMNTELRR